MDDKALMEQCVRDAKDIMAEVFHEYDFDPIGYVAVARLATMLFDTRFSGDSAFSMQAGEDGPTTESEYCAVSRVYSTERIREFLSTDAERRRLCRRLLSLAEWLTSESTRDRDKELIKRYREMAYDAMDAIEETVR